MKNVLRGWPAKRRAAKGHTPGFALIEVVAVLTIVGVIIGTLMGVVKMLTQVAPQKVQDLAVENQFRTAEALIKGDVEHAESFQLETSPTYITLRWRDQSAFPPTNYRVQYYWEEGTLVRQLYVDDVAQATLPLMHRVLAAGDVAFSVTTAANAFVPTSNVRKLSATITVTTADIDNNVVLTSTTMAIQLKPEQTSFVDYRYFYLHNRATPPSGDTPAMAGLPLNETAPTASTLYNYDNDRDVSAGLGVLRGDANTVADTEFQEWVSAAFPSSAQISGSMRIGVYATAQVFAAGKSMTVVGLVKSLNPSTSATEDIGGLVTSVLTSTSSWTEVTIQLPTVSYVIPNGHKLVVRLQFATNSGVAGMLAYDTTLYPSYILVPVIAS